MAISRKDFLRLAASGTAAALAPRVLVAQSKPKKSEKAAIKGATDALTSFITTTTLRQRLACTFQIDSGKRIVVFQSGHEQN